jgi:hypothetical protein
MEMMMSVFVDRDQEMRMIDDAFQLLQDKERLLRTPILEFYGISGIGKTLLLEQIKERCQTSHLPWLWTDLGKTSGTWQSNVTAQVKKYLQQETIEQEQSAAGAIKTLLKRGPVVMLFDAIDEASLEQVREIEVLLRDLITDEKLFVVLASKTMVEFKHERAVARKLKWHSLAALDRKSCEDYLNRMNQEAAPSQKPLDPAIRVLIFAWTQGYPLAMNVMVETIREGYDPRTESGKQKILKRLQERVIDREILRNAQGDWHKICFTLLRLFSVPRRSNLIIMEELIKKFAPDLQRESSLAYFSLPKELLEITRVFSWHLERAGFAVEAPVRSLFLLLYSQTAPQEYMTVHNFLAQLNQQLSQEATGQDRVRYAREYLYHLASSMHITQRDQLQEKHILEAVATILKEEPVILQPFFEEFAQDKELQAVLGPYLAQVELAIEERAAQIKREA